MTTSEGAHFAGAWRHRIPGVDESIGGRYECEADLGLARVPSRLTGERVLDVGCSDGGHSFAAEQRGASVVAIDSGDSPRNEGRNGFVRASEAIGSTVAYHQLSLRQYAATSPDAAFDRIFCFNVLYHLEDIVGGLQELRGLLAVGGTVHVKCIVASIVPERLQRFLPRAWGVSGRPIVHFVADSFEGDPTNWWIPSVAGLVALMEGAGFREVEVVGRDVNRLFVNGTRA